MNGKRYNGIIYFIGLVILATLCTQVYWNYKNYLTGKQQLINDVHSSLDQAVDLYYTQLASENSFAFIQADTTRWREQIRHRVDLEKDSVFIDIQQFEYGIKQEWAIDSLEKQIVNEGGRFSIIVNDSSNPSIKRDMMLHFLDSIKDPFQKLTSKIIVSVTQDSLALGTIDSLIDAELKRKKIDLAYGLSYTDFLGDQSKLREELVLNSELNAQSASPYFLSDRALTIHFSNITLQVLKRNLIGILLSFLLVGSVVYCLMYLLNVIRKQKQLAEIKNDLIGNITHEFKTPIATIGVAMEAITDFDAASDSEKNLRYANISKQQVEKLNVMVEKLLETATLDSEKLQLQLEAVDLVTLLQKVSSPENWQLEHKQIYFRSEIESLTIKVDPFHFENALQNIIDNAIKYGGDRIEVVLTANQSTIDIRIKDNGSSLTEQHKKMIFDKFYRVPKGNTHDVKGYGIGLYYTKKIIEKHQGKIQLDIRPNTCFIISIPLWAVQLK